MTIPPACSLVLLALTTGFISLASADKNFEYSPKGCGDNETTPSCATGVHTWSKEFFLECMGRVKSDYAISMTPSPYDPEMVTLSFSGLDTEISFELGKDKIYVQMVVGCFIFLLVLNLIGVGVIIWSCFKKDPIGGQHPAHADAEQKARANTVVVLLGQQQAGAAAGTLSPGVGAGHGRASITVLNV